MTKGSAISTLYVDIQATTTKLKKQLAQAQQLTQASSQKMGRNFAALAAGTKQVNLETARLPSRLKGATGSFVTLGATIGSVLGRLSSLRNVIVALTFGVAVGLGKAIVGVNASFEDLRSTLNKVTGSASKGKRALEFIRDFAQATPFDVDTLTKSFIQLSTAGIAPTEKFLTSLGDAASVARKPVEAFTSLIKIFSRSTQGGLSTVDLDILNDKGIPVFSILKEELDITRSAIADYGRTAEGAKKITDALLTGFDRDFGGSLSSSVGNLSVLASNLSEAWDDVILAFGNTDSASGFSSSIKFLLKTLNELLTAIKPFAAILGEVFATGVNIATGVLWTFVKAIDAVGRSLSYVYKLMEAENSKILTPEILDLETDRTRKVLKIRRDQRKQVIDSGLERIPGSGTDIYLTKIDAEIEALQGALTQYTALQNKEDSPILPALKERDDSKDFKDTLEKLKEDAKIAKLGFSNLKSTQIDALRDAKLLGDVQVKLIETVNGTVAIPSFASSAQDNVNELLAAEKETRKFVEAAENNRNAIESIRSINNEISVLQATLRDPSGEEAAFLGFKGDIQYTDRQEGIAKQRFKEKRDLIKEIEREEKAQATLDDQLRKARSTVKGLLNDETALEQKHRELTEAVNEFGTLVIPGANEAMEELRNQIKNADPLFQSFLGNLQTLSSGISDAFADMVANSKFSFDGLRSLFFTFVSQLISKAIELLFINRIINALFGLSGGTALPTANIPFTAGAGGGGGTGLGHPGLRATGGAVFSGVPYLVGEKGPEIVVPESAGKVINSTSTRSTLNGGGDTFIVAPNINVNNGSGSTAELIEKITPPIIEATMGAINDSKRRGQNKVSGL